MFSLLCSVSGPFYFLVTGYTGFYVVLRVVIGWSASGFVGGAINWRAAVGYCYGAVGILG
jgi:hypothetical protein